MTILNAHTAELPGPTDTPGHRKHQHPPRKKGLTAIEMQILDLLAAGKTYKQIALIRGRAIGTVRAQLERIYRYAGVTSKTQAVVWWMSQKPSWREPSNGKS